MPSGQYRRRATSPTNRVRVNSHRSQARTEPCTGRHRRLRWMGSPRDQALRHQQYHINRSVQPCFLFVFELNLYFINGNTIWFNSETLFVVFSDA